MASGLGHVWVDGIPVSTTKGSNSLWIESKDIELGSRAHKYIDTFCGELKNNSDTTAIIKLGWRDRLEDSVKWTKEFPLSDFDKLCWTRITGRFFRIRIEDIDPTTIWKLSALEFFGKVGGGRL